MLQSGVQQFRGHPGTADAITHNREIMKLDAAVMGISPHCEPNNAIVGSSLRMHHPRSLAAVLRFRLAAFLLLGNCLFALITAALLVHSILTDNQPLTRIASALLIITSVLVIVQWIAGSRTGCPLCRTPVLAPKRCVKHSRARTILGSHRLRVAAGIIFRNQFRCPYCNESTGMERQAPLRQPDSRIQIPDTVRRRTRI